MSTTGKRIFQTGRALAGMIVENVETAALLGFHFSNFDQQLRKFIGTKKKSFFIFFSNIIELSFLH